MVAVYLSNQIKACDLRSYGRQIIWSNNLQLNSKALQRHTIKVKIQQKKSMNRQIIDFLSFYKTFGSFFIQNCSNARNFRFSTVNITLFVVHHESGLLIFVMNPNSLQNNDQHFYIFSFMSWPKPETELFFSYMHPFTHTIIHQWEAARHW